MNGKALFETVRDGQPGLRELPGGPVTVAQPSRVDDLQHRPEQPLAVMVPAWLEYDVIAMMIENVVTTLDYRNYVIFVGTYMKDARTIAEVERIIADDQMRHCSCNRRRAEDDGLRYIYLHPCVGPFAR